MFTVPSLPNHWLSSNGGSKSRRDPRTVGKAKDLQKSETMDALRNTFGRDIPTFERRVDILVQARIKPNATPKLEDCPRCLQLALDHEMQWFYRLSWQKGLDGKSRAVVNTRSCACYRPEDPSNLSGETTKGLLDGIVWLGVLKDDNRRFVRRYATELVDVPKVADEGLVVTMWEVD